MVMVSGGEFINIENAELQCFHLSAMPAAEKAALKKKLKTKLGHVKSAIEAIGGLSGKTVAQQYPSLVSCMMSSNTCCGDNHPTSTGRKRKSPEVSKQQKAADNFSDNVALVAEKTKAAYTMSRAFKGNTRTMLDGQTGKGLTMNVTKLRQCAFILKKLMTHNAGWVFNQPVDPVKLKIPDYFSVISKPMDLGTVKQNLERKIYSTTHQFAADVRLTFSNAMRYNPPGNDVHVMAKELSNIFNSGWKLLESKWIKDSSIASQQSVLKITLKLSQTSKQVVHSTPSFTSNSLGPKKSAGVAKKHAPSVMQGPCDGSSSGRPRYICVNDEAITSSGCMNSICDKMDCHCSHNDFTQALSSDVDSERSSGRENFASQSIASNLDCKKTNSGVQRSYLSSESDASAIIVDGDTTQPSSDPTSRAATCRHEEDDPLCEEQLSPTRALRAVMLKSRFADTILKAQQKTLLNHCEKGDPARMQREREKLEKTQQEEKARIEAQVKAAEAAARMKAETQLKMQREREREAARLALQKMEKTVDFDENSQIMKDLEDLGYPQQTHLDMPDETVLNFLDGVELQSGPVNPLQQLGLFIKDDDLDEEADNWISAAGNGDVEEGEIGPP